LLGIYSLAGRHGVVCAVEGVTGENIIRGEGDTLDAAYLSACDQARAVGLGCSLPTFPRGRD
jgi:hypothetical protein